MDEIAQLLVLLSVFVAGFLAGYATRAAISAKHRRDYNR
jgi:hypothetical protein